MGCSCKKRNAAMRAEAESKAASLAPAVSIEVPARSITVRDGGDVRCINYLANGCVLNADPRLVVDWLVPGVIGLDFQWRINYDPMT